MAKLRVSAELIAECLFRDADKWPRITGGSWDARGFFVLDVAGDGVPETEGFVEAIITSQPRLIVAFKEIP